MSTYPVRQKPETAEQAGAWIEEIRLLAETAGVELPEAMESGRERIDRARRFRRELSKIPTYTRPGDLERAVAARLVSGDLDLDGAATEVAKAQSYATVRRAVKRAEGGAARQAFDELAAQIDGAAILEGARSAVAQVIEGIRELRPVLDGISGGEQAAAAGPKVAEAWSRYRSELLPRWDAAHELVALLRALYWIRPVPEEIEHGADRYARLDIAEALRRDRKNSGEPALELLHPDWDAAQPDGAPFTEAEARKNARAIEEADAAAEAEEAKRLAALHTRPRAGRPRETVA